MKYKIEVGGAVMVLDAATVERLIEMMADCECITRNWSTQGNAYEIKLVEVENIKLTAMPQANYDALKLVTKLNSEKSA